MVHILVLMKYGIVKEKCMGKKRHSEDERGVKARQGILDFIEGYMKEKGYSPSMPDIAEGCGIASLSTVSYHLNVMERNGVIVRDNLVARSIRICKQEPQLVI